MKDRHEPTAVITDNIRPDRGVVKLEKMDRDEGILKEIADFYVEEWKRGHPGDKNPREWFYVSDVGRCPRSIYYQFKAPEKKRNLAMSTLMMFKMGELFHEETMRVLRGLGYTTGKDIEFGTWSKAGFMKRGRIDAIIRTKDIPAMMVTTEVKSKNPYAFETPEPDQNEVDQLMSYMADIRRDPYFKAKGETLADYGLLLYVERSGLSDFPFAAWKVYYNEGRVAAILSEFESLHEKIEADEIPDRPYTRSDTPCQYCRFMGYCWEGVPLPEEPKPEPDKTVEVPAQEIVESMADAALRLKAEIKAKEKELELAEKVLTAYFKGTGESEFTRDGGAIKFSRVRQVLDVPAMLNNPKLFKIWADIAAPQVGKMREAVKDGKIDGETFERAFVQEKYESLKVQPTREKKGNGK